MPPIPDESKSGITVTYERRRQSPDGTPGPVRFKATLEWPNEAEAEGDAVEGSLLKALGAAAVEITGETA